MSASIWEAFFAAQHCKWNWNYASRKLLYQLCEFSKKPNRCFGQFFPLPHTKPRIHAEEATRFYALIIPRRRKKKWFKNTHNKHFRNWLFGIFGGGSALWCWFCRLCVFLFLLSHRKWQILFINSHFLETLEVVAGRRFIPRHYVVGVLSMWRVSRACVVNLWCAITMINHIWFVPIFGRFFVVVWFIFFCLVRICFN